jgi:hypothetical protein
VVEPATARPRWDGELGKYIACEMAAAMWWLRGYACASAASFDASVLGSESIVAAFGVALANGRPSRLFMFLYRIARWEYGQGVGQ